MHPDMHPGVRPSALWPQWQPVRLPTTPQRFTNHFIRLIRATAEVWETQPVTSDDAFRDLSYAAFNHMRDFLDRFEEMVVARFGQSRADDVFNTVRETADDHMNRVLEALDELTMGPLTRPTSRAATARLVNTTCTDEVCGICYFEMNVPPMGDASALDLECVSPVCGHRFHRFCITMWYNTQVVTCPICRRDPLV